ncbi:MAG: SMC-Scp complex subunit ScpB [Armatimonadota bacterium]
MICDREEKLRALEAVLFAAEGPCDDERLAAVLEVPAQDVEALVADLAALLEGSALQVVQLAGGYQLATRPRFAGYVQRLRQPEPERLSPQALEALAIIAYRQPITRPEIDEIRGVNSSASINSLLAKGLIEIAGRKDAPGRPFLLRTTAHFLSTFGLNDLSELPDLSPVEADFGDQLRGLVGGSAEAAQVPRADAHGEGEGDGSKSAEQTGDADSPASAQAGGEG